MQIDWVPLVQTQWDLHQIPRGMGRFREYLRTLIDPSGNDLAFPPLGIVNPMGKEHVAQQLGQLLALDADRYAAELADQLTTQWDDLSGSYKGALIIADDAAGGWTNRYDYEFALRFLADPHGKRFWISAVLWSSEAITLEAVRFAVTLPLFRAAYQLRNGEARTLRERMRQEGFVMAQSGCTTPTLDPEDLDYTREVLRPFLDTDDKRTAMECLFGDEPGQTLGFTPRGLSPWAGIALALHDARMELASV